MGEEVLLRQHTAWVERSTISGWVWLRARLTLILTLRNGSVSPFICASTYEASHTRTGSHPAFSLGVSLFRGTRFHSSHVDVTAHKAAASCHYNRSGTTCCILNQTLSIWHLCLSPESNRLSYSAQASQVSSSDNPQAGRGLAPPHNRVGLGLA